MSKIAEFKPVRKDPTKVLVRARLSFVHLAEPWGNEGQTKKYSVSCIIPKDDTETIKIIREAIEEAKKVGKDKCWKGSIPKKLDISFRDGDEEKDDPAYLGSMYFSASSRQPVPVVNKLKEDIDPSEAYSGCWGVVGVNFYPYDTNGNRGIAAGLNIVVKFADDDRLDASGNGLKMIEDIDFGTDSFDDL